MCVGPYEKLGMEHVLIRNICRYPADQVPLRTSSKLGPGRGEHPRAAMSLVAPNPYSQSERAQVLPRDRQLWTPASRLRGGEVLEPPRVPQLRAQ
jgi:hypothetical protein